MAVLILIKHSLPEIVSGQPAAEWHLSEPGRLRCQALAEKLARLQPGQIIASLEPKAMETAQIIAHRLGLQVETCAGLHEHERRTTHWTGQADFEANIAGFFAKPDQLVFGEESAAQARQRFSRALTHLLARYPDQNLAVVAHGTVITLFVAQFCAIQPFSFWQSLGLPSFVILSRPDLAMLHLHSIVIAP